MATDTEMAQRHSKDLERLQNAAPGTKSEMLLRWLRDKRESKAELATWLLVKQGHAAHDVMMGLALNRRNGERLRVRALGVMREIGIPLDVGQLMRFNIKVAHAPRPVGAAIAEMVEASLRASNNALQKQV